jgi:DNA-binding protein HU-beta
MNKTELIAAVADAGGESKALSEKMVNAVFDVITAELKGGREVKVPGFGAFDVLERKAAEGRNPATGAKVQIKASKRPRFRAGKGLKEALNPTKKGGKK